MPGHGITRVQLDSLGIHQEVIEHYDKAIEIDPNHVDAWNNKGLTPNYLGRYEEVIANDEELEKSHPKYARAWNNKGLCSPQ